jgi:hypothetical protein
MARGQNNLLYGQIPNNTVNNGPFLKREIYSLSDYLISDYQLLQNPLWSSSLNKLVNAEELYPGDPAYHFYTENFLKDQSHKHLARKEIDHFSSIKLPAKAKGLDGGWEQIAGKLECQLY